MNFLPQFVDFFGQHGYIAVLVALLICSVGVPLPEDITLVAGGVIAGLGYANVHLMVLLGFSGVLVGDLVMFSLGRRLGPRLLDHWPFRRMVPPARYTKIQRQFDKYGNRVLFTARFLPGMRAAIYVAAGLTRRVSTWRFLLLDGAAALVSVPVWVYLGYFGANDNDWLDKWLARSQLGLWLVVAAVAFTVVLYWWYRRRQRVQRLRNRRS